MTDILLSRSASSSSLGKCDRRLDVPVSEELENAIIAMATLRGQTKAELTRSILERVMFGEFVMLQKVAGRSE